MPQLAFTLQIGWQLPDAGNRLETQGQGQEGGWGLAQKAICACASYVWSMSADHQCFLLKRKGGGSVQGQALSEFTAFFDGPATPKWLSW